MSQTFGAGSIGNSEQGQEEEALCCTWLEWTGGGAEQEQGAGQQSH